MTDFTARKIAKYGWRKDLPDHRDYKFSYDPELLKKVADTPLVDLRHEKAMPLVWDQGQLGSCTAHNCGAAWAFADRKAGHAAYKPSRLYIYYYERVIEGTVDQDSGAEIRDGFKVIAKGVSAETKWGYDISKFAEKPPAAADVSAAKHRAITYSSINQDLTSLKAALVSGFPVAFGFTVYSSFESQEVAVSGVVPYPSQNEQVLGGHAVLLVGYDDAHQVFFVRNSWGTEWGQSGYFTMPYSYVLDANLCSDFWQCTVAV